MMVALDRPLPLLRAQRDLLHRPVPPILLVASPIAIAAPGHETRQCYRNPSCRQLEPIWPCRLPPHEPIQRRRIGIGTSEQDGLVLALGHRWSQPPGHDHQADSQCRATSQGQPLASRGRSRGQESCWSAPEQEDQVRRIISSSCCACPCISRGGGGGGP